MEVTFSPVVKPYYITKCVVFAMEIRPFTTIISLPHSNCKSTAIRRNHHPQEGMSPEINGQSRLALCLGLHRSRRCLALRFHHFISHSPSRRHPLTFAYNAMSLHPHDAANTLPDSRPRPSLLEQIGIDNQWYLYFLIVISTRTGNPENMMLIDPMTRFFYPANRRLELMIVGVFASTADKRHHVSRIH